MMLFKMYESESSGSALLHVFMYIVLCWYTCKLLVLKCGCPTFGTTHVILHILHTTQSPHTRQSLHTTHSQHTTHSPHTTQSQHTTHSPHTTQSPHTTHSPYTTHSPHTTQSLHTTHSPHTTLYRGQQFDITLSVLLYSGGHVTWTSGSVRDLPT